MTRHLVAIALGTAALAGAASYPKLNEKDLPNP